MNILEKLDTARNIKSYTKEDLHVRFYKRRLIAVSSKSDNNSFLRWDGAFSLKTKTAEQWIGTDLYREASLVEESWLVGNHF